MAGSLACGLICLIDKNIREKGITDVKPAKRDHSTKSRDHRKLKAIQICLKISRNY